MPVVSSLLFLTYCLLSFPPLYLMPVVSSLLFLTSDRHIVAHKVIAVAFSDDLVVHGIQNLHVLVRECYVCDGLDVSHRTFDFGRSRNWHDTHLESRRLLIQPRQTNLSGCTLERFGNSVNLACKFLVLFVGFIPWQVSTPIGGRLIVGALYQQIPAQRTVRNNRNLKLATNGNQFLLEGSCQDAPFLLNGIDCDPAALFCDLFEPRSANLRQTDFFDQAFLLEFLGSLDKIHTVFDRRDTV